MHHKLRGKKSNHFHLRSAGEAVKASLGAAAWLNTVWITPHAVTFQMDQTEGGGGKRHNSSNTDRKLEQDYSCHGDANQPH